MRSTTVFVSPFFSLFIVLAAFFTTPAQIFSQQTYTGADIGAPPPGFTTVLTNGYELTSASRDIGGTADSFHFAFQQRTGDFDMQVRLENVKITDAFVQAGLVARESLDAGARFAGIFSSSAQIGGFFESRGTAAGASQTITPAVHFPPNYPQMFLRLRRAGNVFTGYASFDGNTWEQLGTATVALPASVFFGMGLASHNTNKVSQAVFRDLQPVQSTSVGRVARETEPLGPSNRRTGVVVSEIMYNPAPRGDTNSLEFVEIYNGESIFVDLTGWRITGGIDYAFPAGFKLEAGEFAVVAAQPALVESTYRISGVLGPFTGQLNNAGDIVRIINAAGATRFEVEYESDSPWPVTADGAGHTLVLARPSYGEDDPRAWAASELIGGSPGQVDPVIPHATKSVVINEFLANTDNPVPDFVELYNASNNSVDLSGCIITDDITTNRFRIPAGSIFGQRAHRSFTQGELGFALSSAGETVYLLSPNGDRVLDAVRFGGQETGVSSGRAPDGSPTIRRLATPTPGGVNAEWKVEDVVINEIMYHPITGDDNEQYVEIHNRSGSPVDLSGWSFLDGINFDFPPGASIPAGGYVVVARDVARLLSNYPNLNANNTLGNFDGSLSRSGERLALGKRGFAVETNQLGAVLTNDISIVVSEMTYFDGGRWPELADGGGSSLELIDARADTLRSSSWAASDETAKAPWTTVEVTARLELGNGTYSANRFQIAMLGAGECLIDDIELVPVGSTNILVNGNFDQPNNSWVFFGNHRGSGIESTGAFSGPNVLHVRAPGDGDTANNSIRGNMVRAITSGNATIRAKVRWLAGWPEVLMRIRGNWMELPARMNVPTNLGTPGQANSRRVNNAGPAIYDVAHYPPLPRANEAVVVTCRITDPDGVANPRVLYRVDPNFSLTTVVMRDDGASGDALAGDGLYSAIIPGRAAGNLVAYRIQASDDAASSVTSTFPVNAPATECLIRWDDAVPFGNFAHYHMWSTAATESARSSSPDLDNTFRDSTLVYNNTRVIYNVGFRDKGSPYHSGGGDFALTAPRDEKLLGVDDRVFASTGNGGSEATGIKTDVSGWIGQELGIPFLHSHFMRLYRNGGSYRNVMYDMEQPNRYFAESWYGSGGVKDDLFKIAIWFEFDDNNGNFNSTSATLQRFMGADGQFKLARYRWNWQIRPSTDTANDYSTIFNLAAAANSTTERVRTLPLLADMEEWMGVFAFHRIIGNWDSYSYNVGQNMYLYAPLGQRSALLPWDIDFVLGEGDGATAALFTAGQDSVIQTLFGVPMYRRMLMRAYQDAMRGPMLPQNFQPQVDARRNALLKNGISSVTTPTSITTYLNARRVYMSNQITRLDMPSLDITSNGGADFTNSEPTVTLTGTAPFAVATIEVNGVPFPVTWSTPTNWVISVPLGGRTNVLAITGRDLSGNVLTIADDTITVFYNGAVPQPQEWVVINEIHYNPLESDAEFLELHNRHPSFAFDLSGFDLSGVGFTLPPGSIIQPNGFLVAVQNRAAFGAAFGPAIPVLGPYPGSLQRNGETLRLIKPGATESEDLIIDEVRYENLPPWPTIADGFGPSLQLIDPAQDNGRVGNWMATGPTDANRATPGRANANRVLVDPYPNVWLNEVAPVNLTGPIDSHGDRDPWLELYNNGSVPVDLSGLTLSDDPTQLGKWQFPTGSRILPGEFLLVWLDGEPGETTTELHTSFRVTATNGVITLSRAQGATIVAIDYLRYLTTSPNNSFGSYPDADPQRRRMLYVPTPGASNDPSIPGVTVRVNEWMAAGQSVLRDPADGQFEDWFELYNAGENTVDLSGYFLSDRSSEALFEIPAGYQIGPKAYRIIWADNEPAQNGPGRDLHMNFALGASGEEIVLFTPDEGIVDAVIFGPQSENVSEGRFPDGGDEPFALFLQPTPGAANDGNFANRPPVITQLPDSTIDEGAPFSATVSASDADLPAQQLTFSLVNPPDGMSINANNGQITWQTSELTGPGNYSISVRVTDNGFPVRSSTMNFRVIVREVNQAPVIVDIPDVTIDEGVPFSVQVQANDPDFPAQALTFGLSGIPDIPTPPAGASIDPETGEFTWTPSEAQGPGVYTINVSVGDGGALVVFSQFNITVRDINNPPVIQPIPDQAIPEGAPFTLQVVATDPEQPPATLTYSLDSAPAGMTINASSGLISWTPAETDGPRDHSIVVRVAEPGGNPSTTLAFILGVNEVNNAPTIEPIGDIVARPGDIISRMIVATDSDLPEQLLTFSATGLPLGANLNPTTGVLSWNVPQDPPAGTNVVTVRVLDDHAPNGSAERTFRIIVEAPVRVVINEIMHRPSVTGGEYVELANISQFNSVEISGWRLEGYNFTFPAGTILLPNSYICVAANLTTFQATYGPAPRVSGNATVTVSPTGGVIRLVDPTQGGAIVVDEVEFSTLAPWPVAPAGISLQLIDPWEDNRRVSNWSASIQSGAPQTSTIIPITANWRYWQQATPPAAGWALPSFSDATWPNGAALLYVEGSALPAPKSTPLTIGRTVYYFRTVFNFSGNTNGATLRINSVVDDGVIYYLNGQEVYRLGMPGGAVDDTTFSSRVVDNAVFEGPTDVPALGLRQGDNVVAARVHQANAGSTDIVFGAAIDLVTTTPVSYTPGAPNSVGRDLPTIPPVWINEVHPVNTTGITDGEGGREPWFELHNTGNSAADISGWFLTDDLAALERFALPANTVIPANGYLLVWTDGETGSGLHAPFRLRAEGGTLTLSTRQEGTTRVVDHVQYPALSNQSFGSAQDGQPIGRVILAQATPGAANSPSVSEPTMGVSRSAANGSIRISWATVVGQTYSLESTTDLSSTWQTISTEQATGPEMSYTTEANPSGDRYYRVRNH